MSEPLSSKEVAVGQVWTVGIPMCVPKSQQEEIPMSILAVVDGYAWCRLLDAVPFTHRVSKWHADWRLQSETTVSHRSDCAVAQSGFVPDVTPGHKSACTCDFTQRLREIIGEQK